MSVKVVFRFGACGYLSDNYSLVQGTSCFTQSSMKGLHLRKIPLTEWYLMQYHLKEMTSWV